jgi:WD40 repeat protein
MDTMPSPYGTQVRTITRIQTPPIDIPAEQANRSSTSLKRHNSLFADQSTPADASIYTLFSAKKKRPKNDLTRTKSSFFSRAPSAPSPNPHSPTSPAFFNEELTTLLLYNTGKAFFWTDLELGQKEHRLNFSKAFPTCHDVNLCTKASDGVDVVIGFSSGDIIWFDPLANRYLRVNKQGLINSSAVTSIRWCPNSEHVFMASYENGDVVLYHKDKDDQSISLVVLEQDQSFKVTRIGKTVAATGGKNARNNPISYWQVCNASVSAVEFSPDGAQVAIVSMDGCLRIVDFEQEALQDTFRSYYGGLTCVAWSPDSQFLLTGGQDDLVSVWSVRDKRIIARCQGHSSWVSAVAFDVFQSNWEYNLVFASVGEDGKILLWELTTGALHRPKGVGPSGVSDSV